MTHESCATMIVDEIDRLSVAYDKAKEYLSKITTGIEQQIDLWQYRRQIILDQVIQMKSSSSYDFLLPKTQRINELAIEAVEGLCRVDLLMEQILRIDPKSRTNLVPTRPLDTNISLSHIRHPTPSEIKQPIIPNGKLNGQSTLPVPVLRTQHQIPSGRLSTLITQEKTGFKPVIQQQTSSNMFDTPSRPSSIQPLSNNLYPTTDGFHSIRPIQSSYGARTPLPDYRASPVVSSTINPTIANYQPRRQQQPPHGKEKIKLQRIPGGTKWKQAKIDIIDSLSGFYAENLDPKVHEKFQQMQDNLHNYYDNLDKSNELVPLESVAIGDFGVAKYNDDQRWYRARLIMCEGHNQIKIVYVDFGNIEVKSIDEFFPLRKLFTELPAQAIACSLSQAFPLTENENDTIWPDETIQIFKHEVLDKILEIHFDNQEEGTEQWPLHFVRVYVDNQLVTNLQTLQKRIDPRPNRFIAEQMAPTLTQQEYILFNVPISEDDVQQ